MLSPSHISTVHFWIAKVNSVHEATSKTHTHAHTHPPYHNLTHQVKNPFNPWRWHMDFFKQIFKSNKLVLTFIQVVVELYLHGLHTSWLQSQISPNRDLQKYNIDFIFVATGSDGLVVQHMGKMFG